MITIAYDEYYLILRLIFTMVIIEGLFNAYHLQCWHIGLATVNIESREHNEQTENNT